MPPVDTLTPFAEHRAAPAAPNDQARRAGAGLEQGPQSGIGEQPFAAVAGDVEPMRNAKVDLVALQTAEAVVEGNPLLRLSDLGTAQFSSSSGWPKRTICNSLRFSSFEVGEQT